MRNGFALCAALVCQAAAAGAAPLTGVVLDIAGMPVPGARVDVLTVGAGTSIGAILASTQTGTEGAFRIEAAAEFPLRIRVSATGFGTRETALRSLPSQKLELRLIPGSSHSSVTVTATPTARGIAEDVFESPHVAIVRTEERLREQPLPTLGHALAHEPGVLLQQSTWSQVSPFLRGLTGYHVLNLMDGVRYNNSTFRSGPNQYLALIEPNQAQQVEAVLGPTGAAWGSDSLGGTINVVTSQPNFASDRRPEMHGQFRAGAASADVSGTATGNLSVSTPRLFLLGGLSGRRHNDLRAGGGFDSRNVFHRLFGMAPEAVRDLTGSRQQDSGFSQHGAEARFGARLRQGELLTVNFQRGVQSGVRGYKDLLGGLGRVLSTFEPQELNWLYARYEKVNLGWLDSLSGTFSLNSQSDGGRRQNLSFADPVTTDFAKVNVFGYTGQATTHAGSRLLASFGGDIYDEHIDSTREVLNPVTGSVARPRPLYPDGSRYGNFGAFAQGSYQVLASVRAAGGVRLTGVRFATREDAAFRIPRSSQWFRDVTFHSSVQWQLTDTLGVHAVASRGFRAPNLNDLGALGLNDLGYEIPSSDAIAAGALLATDAGESAVSKQTPLGGLTAESLMNYEGGVRVRTRRVYARAQFFFADLYNPIVRRTLLFPGDAVPSALAGQPVTPIAQTAAQAAQGVVAVATSIDPRAVKAFVNDGQSRYYGVETTGRALLTTRLAAEGNFSYLVGRDLYPNRNIRRLPPAMGTTRLRYTPTGRRPWVEFSVSAAGEQSRLSGGDRDDERMGASFRRADIASFFRGSRVAALTDSVTGQFLPTGETLLQIQNRVLPIGTAVNGVRVTDDNTRVPLYLSTAGWTTVNVRAGFPLGEQWQLNGAVENLLDTNYRYHGSGVDAPGVNVWVGVRFAF